MTLPILADATPEIETWKMIVTLICALITVGGTWVTATLSGRLKRKEQHYGAQIDRALQEHKAALDKQAKEYEAQLEHFAFENQTRFAQLHLERARIVAELYKKFVSVFERAEFIALNIGREEANSRDWDRTELPNFNEEIRSLKHFIREHVIYFPPNLCTLLDMVNNNVKFIETMHFNVQTYVKDGGLTRLENALSHLERVKVAIENEFREMLGVPTKPDKILEL